MPTLNFSRVQDSKAGILDSWGSAQSSQGTRARDWVRSRPVQAAARGKPISLTRSPNFCGPGGNLGHTVPDLDDAPFCTCLGDCKQPLIEVLKHI